MRIVIVHNARFPVLQYGGTERAIWWLTKGLSELGVGVTLACQPGSQSPFAKIHPVDFSAPVGPQLAAFEKDSLFHYFAPPGEKPSSPYLVTIEGNGKAGERFLRNTVFVSRNHAERHHARSFVYNGIDPDDYVFSSKKSPFLIFLAKAAWRVKNARGAIRLARRSRKELHIVGGSRWWLPHWRGVHWEGMLGGEAKKRWITEASGLLFPVLWHEPFGIAVVECLVSGTPVIASRLGSLPELVPPSVGFLCQSEEAFLSGISRLNEINPTDCREWAAANFHYRVMTQNYVAIYEKIWKGQSINESEPYADQDEGRMVPLR